MTYRLVTQIRYKDIMYWIRDKQSGMGASLSASTSGFARQ